jgi:P-type Ca2+ transporter type 2C
MFDSLVSQLFVLAFAMLPLSLLIIRAIQKFLSNYHPGLAGTSTICSNLDGNLTSNTWLVKSIMIGNVHLEIDENQRRVYFENYKTREEKELSKTDLVNFKSIKTIMNISKLCHYEKSTKLEEIILTFLDSCGINSSFVTDKHLKIEEIPSKDKKFSTFIYQRKETQEIFAYSKGNALKLLDQCSRTIIDGKKVEISHPLKRKFKKRIKILNKRGEKIIAFAYKGLPRKKLDYYKESYVENDLIFIGMVGIGDYPNKKLIPIIKELKEIGLKHFILTSARERRAVAIAKELKIVNPLHFESIPGGILEDINKTKLKKILSNQDKNYVFSELNPEQKNRIIETLRNQGENIAISKADSASGLKTILSGIKEGRQNENTKAKISSHAISCKIAQILLIVACILFKVPLAFTVSIIIALDLGINLLLEISLKRDTSEGAKAELKQSRVIMNGILNGIFLTGIYIWSLMRFGWHPFNDTPLSQAAIDSSVTLVFILLSMMQIANAYNIKHSKETILKLKNIANIYLALSSFAVILVLYILSKFELLGLTKLENSEILLIGFITFLLILFEEIRKLIHNVVPQN